MKASIIIPVKDNHRLTEECIKSIKENTENYEIIIVDNGSDPAYTGEEKIIRNEENLGFPKAVNQGIKAATGEAIVVLNNDTLVTPQWLDFLIAHFKDYDIVGPCTNSISGPQQIKIEDYKDQASLNYSAAKYHNENRDISMPWHRLVFYCVAIKKEVIDKIGLLDEQFSPGNFEDDDFCLRAIEAGFRLGIAQDVFIHHIGQATHKSLNIDFTKLMQTNLAKFQAKWSGEKYKELQDKNFINCGVNQTGKQPTLALVMIVKNEEKGLEKAILSCRDFVKEIVIAIDNSSNDKTEDVAKKYATTLKHFDWQDDFAWARNFAGERVKTDWILFLDGHEYVAKAPDLKKHLRTKANGLMCAIEMENGMIFGNPRIYRKGFKFEGKVHERQTCLPIDSYPEFLIKHDRFGGQAPAARSEREKQRNDQVPRIMGALYKKNKRNTRAIFHLALSAATNRDFRGAIRWWRRFLRYAKNRAERWYAFFNLSQCHFALGHSFRAYWYASRSDDETPGRWETARLKGLILFQKRKFSKAAEFFVESFSNNTCIVHYKPWRRDVSGTYNLIGECLFNQGIFDKASLAFSEAAKTCTDKKFKKILEDRAKLMIDIFKSNLQKDQRSI